MTKQYKKPEDMIEHNENLDTVSGLMSIFFAYNQKETDEGTTWSNWPDWELCLTSMKDELHFKSDDDTDEIKAERKQWLALFQLIHENEDISFDEYTVAIQGQHGNTFSFDLCIENGCWVNTGAMAEYNKRYEEWKKDKQKKSWMTMRSCFYHRGIIDHSLGPFWTCPSHVPDYGGESTVHTPDSWYCFHRGLSGSLPAELISLILLCIDDCEIWRIQFKEDQGNAEYIQRMEREWPGGRPEDYEYQ